MLGNHIKFAFRNLLKQKTFTFINIFGLTTGLVCFLMIALYIFDELTYDAFHKSSGSIYRVVEAKTSADGKQSKVVSTAFNISEGARKSLPGVEGATRFSMLGRVNVSAGEGTNVFYESYFIGDASFFTMFSFPVLQGNAATALNEPHTAVLTDETALKIFGTTNAVGKTLVTDGDSIPHRVTAVISIPDNSHLKFNILFSEATLYASADFMKFAQADWSSNSFVTYLQLREGADASQIASRLNALTASKRTAEQPKSSFILQPLRDIHFHSAGLEGEMGSAGNLMHMYVFGIVALFVLLIACINYMNLTTARFAVRSKEIAVRKVAGASQGNLVRQFLTEASLVTVISLVLSLAFIKLLLPRFNAFTEKKLSLDFNTDWRLWAGVVLVVIIVSIISGIYPALVQSRLKPYLLLKNKITGVGSQLSVRRVLVVFQFALSIIMIVATMIVYQQLKYVENRDMGFNKEQLLVVDINSGAVRRSAEAIKSEFGKIASVQSVSATSRVPGEWKVIPKVKLRSEGRMTTPGEDVYYMVADEQFLNTFQVKLLSGRNFRADAGDSTSVMINESAAQMLGISEPSGQVIEVPSVAFSGNASILEQPFRAQVIGIVKDFNFRSLREKVAPMVVAWKRNPVHNIDYFTVRVGTGNLQETIDQMKAVLAKVDASHLFEYNFLDKQWDLFYREDQKRQVIFLSVALLTIIIACLGLFGLATYAAQQRIKEIGIRKVLGASVGSIVAMLSKEFLKLVVVAAVIAFPIAWWAMDSWLQDFAYRVNIHWWVFLVAAVVALVIALFTMSFQTMRAALANPIKNLRTE
jgi:putative ABC transport system permease protein